MLRLGRWLLFRKRTVLENTEVERKRAVPSNATSIRGGGLSAGRVMDFDRK